MNKTYFNSHDEANWSTDAWKKLSKNWSCEKEHFYKELFVSKELEKVLMRKREIIKIPQKKVIRVADFGCGDGYMTALFIKTLQKLLSDSTEIEIVFIDISKEFLVCAEYNIKKEKISRIKDAEFLEIDISKPFNIKEVDIVFSSFTLHNIGNIKTLLENFRANSTCNAIHIHAFLCPLFVEVLRHKGAIKVIEDKELWDKEVLLWRYKAWYPIVGKEKQLVYYPYFHRYVGDYIQTFLSYGISPVSFSYHKPNDKNLLNYIPFQPRDKNIYFPEIWEYPSLNIFIGGGRV